MKLIEAADATSIITTVIGYFTQNWPALAILIGFGVGLAIVALKVVSSSLRGMHFPPRAYPALA